MKRKAAVIAVIAICLSLSAHGTLSYFTAENAAHNVITTGGVDIELQEWADAEMRTPFPESGVGGVMPGSSVTKIVVVKNVGESAAYVRSAVGVEVFFADGTSAAAPPLLSIDFNAEDWLYSGGYYYYFKALEPGETSEPIFTQVKFDASLDNRYQNSRAVVSVVAYATQSANNGSDPLLAIGWHEP